MKDLLEFGSNINYTDNEIGYLLLNEITMSKYHRKSELVRARLKTKFVPRVKKIISKKNLFQKIINYLNK